MKGPSRSAAAAALLKTVRAALAEAADPSAGRCDATLRRALTALGVIERTLRDDGLAEARAAARRAALPIPASGGDPAAVARALRRGVVGEGGEAGRVLHGVLRADAEDALAISNPLYLEKLAEEGEAPG